MKKVSILFALVVFSVASIAQNTISNPGFEQWNQNSPVNWSVKMSGYVSPLPIPLNFQLGSKTTDKHSGNSAVLLQSQNYNMGTFSFSIPGMLQLGNSGQFNIPLATVTALINMDFSNMNVESLTALSSLKELLASGVPFSQIPSSVKAWIKYLPAEGSTDSMTIYVYASKWNPLLNISEPAAFGIYSSGITCQNYTQIEIPVVKNENVVDCDTLRLIFTSGGFTSNTETKLFVDDVTFDFNSSIDQANIPLFTIYPNPASRLVVIRPENNHSYDIAIFDASGKKIKDYHDLANQSELDITSFAPGFYFIKFMQDGKEIIKKMVVE